MPQRTAGPHGEIREQIRRINDAWAHGRAQELEQYFHQDMIIVAPEFGGKLEGRAACVESYREFAGRADIEEVRESDLTIDVTGPTAVASYRFEVTYSLHGARHRDTGWDVFVFTREADRWWAVWRTMIVPGGAP